MGGVQYNVPISFKNLAERLNSLDGKGSTGPISASSLLERIEALEKGICEIWETSTGDTAGIQVPEKYRGWKYVVLQGSIKYKGSVFSQISPQNNGGTAYLSRTDSAWFNFHIDSNMKLTGNSWSSTGGTDENHRLTGTFKVLFYK